MKSLALAILATITNLACRDRAVPSAPLMAPPAAARILDNLDDPALPAWQASGSEGVTASVRSVAGASGRALRLELDLGGTAGYAVARRALPLELPPDFELTFQLRGDVPINHFELKLIDASGENVWWYRRGNFAFPARWQRIAVKRRQIEFAWGPTRDRTLRRIAAIEIVVAAGRGGGAGAIELDELALRPRVPVPDPPPPPRTVASAGGVTLDLQVERDLGGALVRWPAGATPPARYALELSRDGQVWEVAATVTNGAGRIDPVPLPDASARYLRIAGGAPAITVIDAAAAPTPNGFMAALARTLPRGAFPRAYLGEQSYWTVVGTDGGARSGLLSEDGALELWPGGPSLEPFLVDGGQVTSWASAAAIEHGLVDGDLPIPIVRWRMPRGSLEITALATAGVLATRYTVTNTTTEERRPTLALALRPLQVNPPTQFLNIAGGVAPIRSLAWTGGTIAIDGVPAVQPLTAPARVSLRPLAGFVDPTTAPTSEPAIAPVDDPAGYASALLEFPLAVPPGGTASVVVISGAPPTAPSDPAWFARVLAAERTAWRARLDRVAVRVPAAGRRIVDTLRSSLAYMLISRDGPILRPGTRSYARAWIRDGAMISEALLRLGHAPIAIDFLRWYAPYQFPSGRVPCCVEPTGAVPVPEHDSHGQLIHLVADVYRYTRDRAQLVAMWPHVRAAARAIEELRASEPSGLLPPSISHEGYSAKPAYAYWDNFWCLTGLADAAELARDLGHAADATAFAAARDDLRADLLASITESAARHGIDFIPGAADLGDFDATSTTIALAPAGLQRALPPSLLTTTFERAWTQLMARGPRDTWPGTGGDYTPYELRLVGTFVRLGWRARAIAALERYFQDQRPAGWNQWAEVVGKDPRAPRFLGDMPHAWVHSDYARAALDLFAYHRLEDGALVLAAGIPIAWFAGDGFAIANLATPFGALGYATSTTAGVTTIRIDPGPVPPGGIVIPWPFDGTPGKATVDGRPTTWNARELVLHRRPATVRLWRAGASP